MVRLDWGQYLCSCLMFLSKCFLQECIVSFHIHLKMNVEWTLPRESGYLVNKDFASSLGLALMLTLSSRLILGTKKTFLPPWLVQS